MRWLPRERSAPDGRGLRGGDHRQRRQARKSFFAGNYQVGLGSNAGVAAALVQAEKFALGPRDLDEFPARIRAVTREQVNAATKKHVFPDKLHVIVAGDLDKLP